MTFTLFTVALLLLTAICIAMGAVRGHKRGIHKTSITFGTAFLSIFLASFISIYAGENITYEVNTLIMDLGVYEETADILPNLSKIISVVSSMLGSVLLFIPIYLGIRLLCSIIIHAVIKRKIKKSDTDTGYESEAAPYHRRRSRALGAALGAVCGATFAVIITFPFIGTFKVIGDVLSVVNSFAGSELDEDTMEEMNKIETYSDDIFGNVLYASGGKVLFNMTAKTSIYGKTVALSREIKAINDINIEEFMSVFENINDPGEENLDAFRDYCKKAESSYVAKLFLADILSTASKKWLMNESYLGIDCPDFGEDEIIKPFVTKILQYTATSNQDTVVLDIETLLSVTAIISEFDWNSIGDDYEILFSSSEDSLLTRVCNVLNANPHMSGLIDEAYDIAMRSIASELEEYINDQYPYEELLGDFATSFNWVENLSDPKKVEEMTSYIGEYLDDYGIDVPENLSEIVAGEMVDEFSFMAGSVTSDDLKYFFESYLNNSN